MPAVKDVCHVRTKNAGSNWVTCDLFFHDKDSYEKFAGSPALGPDVFERLYGVDPRHVKRFTVDSLNVLKISWPRLTPQGGMVERDMHSGQQYVRLLDIELV